MPGRGIRMGSRASTVAGAVAHISAAHITDNLLRSARSIRNKVLPTPFPCWHPSFQFPSACRFPGHQLCSQLLVLSRISRVLGWALWGVAHQLHPKGWQIIPSKHSSLDFSYLDVDVYVYSSNAMYKIIHVEFLEKWFVCHMLLAALPGFSLLTWCALSALFQSLNVFKC